MKKLKGMSGLATVVLTAGLVTTVQAEDVATNTVKPAKQTAKSKVSKVAKVSQTDLTKSEEALKDSEEKVAEQEAALAEATAAEKEVEKKLGALTEEVSELEDLVGQATPETIADTEVAIANTEEKQAEANQVVTAGQEDLKAAETVLTDQETVVNDANTSLEKAEKDLLVAEELVRESEANLSDSHKVALETRLEDSKQTLAETKATVDANTKALAEAEKSDVERAEELAKLDAQLKEAEEAFQAKQENLEQAQADTVAKQAQFDDLQRDVARLKATIAHLEETLKIDKTAAIKELEKALDNVTLAQTELRLAEQALALAEQSEKQRQEAIKQARARLQAEQDKYARAQSELERITREYQAAKPNPSVTSVPYYAQTDPHLIRHVIGRGTFGATGCVPTALAMIFSELLGRTVAPLEVGHWLYHNTDDFNKAFDGTSGVGVLKATKAYGLEPTVLPSHDALVQALQEGHLVTAAVQNNKFSPWGPQYSHQIVLKGYSNGNTYVYDPYTRANIGWYPVINLWREQSRDAIDTNGLGIPFVKITSPRVAQLASAKKSAESTLNNQAYLRDSVRAQLSGLERQTNAVAETTPRVSAARTRLTTANSKANQARVKVADAEKAQKAGQNQLMAYRNQLTAKEADVVRVREALDKAKTAQSDAQAMYDMAGNGLVTLSNRRSAVAAQPVVAPVVKANLVKLARELDKAEKAYQDALLALEKFKASKEEKLALLEEARADVMIKAKRKEEAKEILRKALIAYTEAKASRDQKAGQLEQAKSMVEQKATELLNLRSRLSNLQEAPAKLETVKANLSQAQADLAVKKDLVLKELEILKSLQSQHVAVAEQHANVLTAYKDYLEAERYSQWLENLAKVQKEADQTKLLAVTSHTMPAKSDCRMMSTVAKAGNVSAMSTQSNLTRVDKQLPKTGDGSSLLSLAMASVSLALGFAFQRQSKK